MLMNTTCGVFFVVAATIPTILWLIRAFKKLRYGTTRLPPGPQGLPLVGYLPFLGTNVLQSFTELAHVHGPIFKLWLGSKLCVVLSSPSIIKEVVRDQDTTFANRDLTIVGSILSNGGSDIVLAPYDLNWRLLRKIFVREMLSNAKLDACYTLRRHEVRKSISHVYRMIGTPVNIGELIFSTVFNATTSMLWGETLEGEKGTRLGAEFGVAVVEISMLLGKPNVSDFFPVLARFDIQGIERKTKKITLWINRIFDFVLDQRMKVEVAKKGEAIKNEKKDFLQFLLELKGQEDSGTSITLEQIKALLMDIVLGGTDTTSTTVEWAMAKMMRHPEVMKKVHEELTSVVGVNNIVEECHLPKLHYLDAVVKETLRLHPVLPLLVPRSPSLSSTVGGYTIPKGTKVYLNIWAMHRDPQIWDSPLEFQPERFSSNFNKLDYSGNNFQYLPFGSGRRICAGLPLAERMLVYVLASFLHSFDWKLPYGTEVDLSEKFGMVMRKSTPLVAIPTQRISKLEFYT